MKFNCLSLKIKWVFPAPGRLQTYPSSIDIITVCHLNQAETTLIAKSLGKIVVQAKIIVYTSSTWQTLTFQNNNNTKSENS